MLMAFVSDIHGNLPALEAAFADAKARGARQVVCAGDLTGYGPFPDEVCRFLEERRIPAIIGNYDQKVIEAAKQGRSAAARMKQKKRKILLLDGGAPRRLGPALPGRPARAHRPCGSRVARRPSSSMAALSPWTTRSIRASPGGAWTQSSATRSRISSSAGTPTSLS